MTLCKICGAETRVLFGTRVLHKYDVDYLRCAACGFVQTDEPVWLQEAYADAINDIDLGPVNRALTCSTTVEGVILSHLDPRGRFLDFGAGYGLFVRLMRDRGYDFAWHDTHCENLFAKHFVRQEGVRYDLVTAFEVFEHLVDPVAEIGGMIDLGANVLFSTLLVPDGVARQEDWWYFGPEHGQHIAFYTLPALRILAERFRLHLSSDGVGMHMLSAKPMSPRLFALYAKNGKKSAVLRRLLRRRHHVGSLLNADFQAVSGHALG